MAEHHQHFGEGQIFGVRVVKSLGCVLLMHNWSCKPLFDAAIDCINARLTFSHIIKALNDQ